jgi:hypothetical protein
MEILYKIAHRGMELQLSEVFFFLSLRGDHPRARAMYDGGGSRGKVHRLFCFLYGIET